MSFHVPGKRLLTVLAVLSLLLASSGRAKTEPWSLPPELQGRVNSAIYQGVRFLKTNQRPYGGWSPLGKHPVGYAALPGLTLLECGASPTDPLVAAAADFVRKSAPTLQATYEISLSIIFLDRLGNPRDEKLIQTLALRLIAGQSTTGGWSYKCPILKSWDSDRLLTILKKIKPPPLVELVGGGINLANPLPGPNGEPKTPLPRGNTELANPLPGGGTDLHKNIPGGKNSALPTILPRSRDERAATSGAGRVSPGEKSASPGEQRADDDEGMDHDTFRPHYSGKNALCIKMDETPNNHLADGKNKPTKPRTIVIPAHLARLPVLNDPVPVPYLFDVPGALKIPGGTTDNSNSQFAIMALWAARRHGVPMVRTLNLMARRYLTSQNPDGSWGYRYVLGGGRYNSPAMTCVGLLGLAVAHGFAREEADRMNIGHTPVIEDPRILKGFLALYRNVGRPTGQMQNLRMENLYFLWSVERVGVLYSLPAIGDKDWYAWGAEILAANQHAAGNWLGGKYHGSDYILDTCFALLFLKRVNLTRDLTDRLPISPINLSKAISKNLHPALNDDEPRTVKKKPVSPGHDAKRPEPSLRTATATEDHAPRDPSPESLPPPNEGDSTAWIWVLGILALVLILVGALVLLLPGSKETSNSSQSRKAKSKPRKLAAN
jgi:hypothetical protein